MSQTGPYDDEFAFASSPQGKGPPKGERPFALPRKSTVAISLALIGSAFFLARGCWYYGDDRDNRYYSGRVGGGYFFYTGGGSGYRGGPSAPRVGGPVQGSTYRGGSSAPIVGRPAQSSGYRGGPSAPTVGGSARGGFGSTGVHAVG